MAKRKKAKDLDFSFDEATDKLENLDKEEKKQSHKETEVNSSITSTGGNKELEQINSKKRVKITTMINPELRDKLKLLAVKNRCNFSDMLEEAIKKYLNT